MSGTLNQTYDEKFYANQREGSLRSAGLILSRLRPVLGDVKSVLDVGCGSGAWLKTAQELFPETEVTGLDHPDVPQSQMYIDTDRFIGRDLSGSFDLEKKFDLAISLEVAEHIDPAQADQFIDNLTSHSDRVLFSAAVPRQGGSGHVNEQWPDYWAEKYQARGFRQYDIIRPMIWLDDGVASWYAQNTFLYVKDGAQIDLSDLEDWGGRAMIHPGSWMRKTEPLSQAARRVFRGEKPSHTWR
ncbi:MAG: class I SAM-dependent methyltransferase [Pseudomonadota bacterium]